MLWMQMKALNTLDRVDLCIIDVTGDNAGGLSVARQIRSIAGPELPLVLMSDDGHHHYEPDVVTLSIVKPVAGAQLHQLLSALVRNTVKPNDTPISEEKMITSSKSIQILVVEDEVDNQKLALHFLNKLGYEATLATNGLEAIHAFDESYYDVVLMDIQMPEMDGQTATAHIRAATYPDGNPWIIAVTARAMVGDRERFLEAGLDDYLSKPYSKESLVQVLERAKSQISPANGLIMSEISQKTT